MSTGLMMHLPVPTDQVRIQNTDELAVVRLAEIYPKVADSTPDSLRALAQAMKSMKAIADRNTDELSMGAGARYRQYQLDCQRRMSVAEVFAMPFHGGVGHAVALAFARALAALCGQEVTPITAGHGYSPRAAVNAILRHIGRYLSTASDALADDKLTRSELDRLDSDVDALANAIAAYRAARLHAAMDTGN